MPIGAPAAELADLYAGIYPDGIPPHHQGPGYGSSMVVTFTRGDGEVFCAGTTDWPYGLEANDPFVTIITRNVLDRFIAAGRDGAQAPATKAKERR